MGTICVCVYGKQHNHDIYMCNMRCEDFIHFLHNIYADAITLHLHPTTSKYGGNKINKKFACT